jgi:hypothetical protein
MSPGGLLNSVIKTVDYKLTNYENSIMFSPVRIFQGKTIWLFALSKKNSPHFFEDNNWQRCFGRKVPAENLFHYDFRLMWNNFLCSLTELSQLPALSG